MKRTIGVTLLTMGLMLQAHAGPGGTRDAAPRPAAPRLDLTDDAIRRAVRETLAETPPPARDDGPVLRGDAYERFERQFDDARMPSCWHPDAMKHQPAQLGPIALGGILALPFWGAAIVSGKCR